MISLICLSLAVGASGATYHVSPTGPKNGDGLRMSTAFRTISRAVAAMKPGDTCIVHQGVYRETVVPACDRVKFMAAKGEAVEIRGSDPIDGWSPVSTGVFRAKMPWNYDQDYGSNQVFKGSTMLEELRWPKNGGTLTKPTDAKVVEAKDAGGDRIEFRVTPAWDQPDGRWDGAQAWVNLSHNGQDGQGQTGKVVSTNRAAGTITVAGLEKRSWDDGKYDPNKPWGIGPGTELHLFRPTSAGLDQTGGPQAALARGEWWRGDDGYLYVHAADAGKVEAKRRTHAFDLTNRSFVTVSGFRLFGCSITTDKQAAERGKSIAASHDVLLENLQGQYLSHFTDQSGQFQMQWLQKSGIILSGRRQTLKGCDLRFAAGPLVSVIGSGNRVIDNTLRDGNYSVSEAGVLDCGRSYDPEATYSYDHEIAYNTLFDSPQQGMNIRGLVNSNPTEPGLARIHHNVIHDVMLRAHDSGAIDQFGTDGQGVRIDHNVIYNLPGELQFGIYLDFGLGYVIDHNLIYNVERPIQFNWTEGGKTVRLSIFNNTCVSTETRWRQAGIQNGVGQTNRECDVRLNLSALPVRIGKDGTSVGNQEATDGLFVDAKKGDYRLKTPAAVGAFPKGEPTWSAGARRGSSGAGPRTGSSGR